jgi:hypothetical protein
MRGTRLPDHDVEQNKETQPRELPARAADQRVAADHGACGGTAVAVTSNVPGATVRIGGLTYGGTPLTPRPIKVGKLVIAIEKVGWKRAELEIEAIPGIVTDVVVELAPMPPKAKPRGRTGS